jgi:glycosyltransferase involved in cell wall biosynthesis
MPSITIILPVYNGERYLREAIDSVLAQTYHDFELWVCNDGSTDSTVAIADSYTDPRVRRIDNPHNMGLVATLNRAFAMVDSPFIARMDDDDLWEPDKLERQMALLAARPDVGICGTSIHKFGDIDSVMIFPEESDALKVGLLFYCMMSHPSVVYRRSMLQQTGLTYRADFFPAEDYKMWIDALQHTHIYNLEQPLVHYRQHATQICREKKEDQIKLERRLHEEQLRLIYPNPTDDELAFHLDRFVTLHPVNDDEVCRFSRWGETLCRANNRSRYVNPTVLRHELSRYVQNAIRSYYTTTWRGLGHHLFSGRWRHLDLKHNLSLLRHGYRS